MFLDKLSEFLGAALGAGGACLVIATAAHRQGVPARLNENGIELDKATRDGRYLTLDAEETLAQFMVGNWPDETLFFRAIEPKLLWIANRSGRRVGPVVAFGEMVAVLWEEGKREAAIHLEKLWNKLVQRHNFVLRCAYPMRSFAQESYSELFQRVCSEHAEVIPVESYTLLNEEDERLRMVSSLQQQASTVQSVLEDREREITYRKQVEEKLWQSEEFARNVLESSVDCVEILDLDGKIEYMSPPGRRALEIGDVNEVLGRRWVDFWKEQDKSRAEAAIESARAGRVGSFGGECFTAGGALKSWDVKITAIRDRNGEIERLVAVSRDITELRRVQQTAIQAEKLAATGRLAATIAHEINNPLEAVTNFIYLATTTKGLPDEVCRYLTIADRELARVAQIARQTLGFYRDNSISRWIDVADLMRDLIIIYERKLANKRLETEISVAPGLKVYGKHGELRQALSNLLANAIDASGKGGKIWLRAQKSRNWMGGMEPGIRVTLADNGSGMSPEVKKRIFVPFFTTKSDVGTGIGLWATKCLIEQQGGFVRFHSKQGQRAGTVMSLFLPGVLHEEPEKMASC